MATRHPTGVYCLANDSVLEWMLAFLESLRAHEPSLPLTVIPFDERIEQLERLSERYAFDVMDHPALGELDALGASLWPSSRRDSHRLRKLAAFWGPYETFVCLDSDAVVLSPLGDLFSTLESSGADILYSDADIDEVYLPGLLRNRMVSEHGTRAFDTGSFVARRLALGLDEVRTLARELDQHADEVARSAEQPILNYCVDRKGLRALRLSEADDRIAFTCWAGKPGVELSEMSKTFLDDEGKWVPFLHWARSAPDASMRYHPIFADFRSRAPEPLPALEHPTSRIARNAYGLGLVATVDLGPGTLVAHWDGPVLPYEDVPDEEKIYVLDFGGNRFMIPATEARYINHSCEPNCRLDSNLRVLTTTDVSAGEELTYHYVLIGRESFEAGRFWDERWTFDCQCGSPACLGRIDTYICRDDGSRLDRLTSEASAP